MWKELRASKLGVYFRRQQVIQGFIVDFYCHMAGLVIEVDGDVHDLRKEEDERRDWRPRGGRRGRLLNGRGYRGEGRRATRQQDCKAQRQDDFHHDLAVANIIAQLRAASVREFANFTKKHEKSVRSVSRENETTIFQTLSYSQIQPYLRSYKYRYTDVPGTRYSRVNFPIEFR